MSKVYSKKGLGHLFHNPMHHTANSFPFMYFQKRFRQVSLLISAKYFQNRIIMFCLELMYIILETSTVLEMQPFACKHREQHIYKRNYEILVPQVFIFPNVNYKDDPLYLLFPFLKYTKVYIWDLGLWFG